RTESTLRTRPGCRLVCEARQRRMRRLTYFHAQPRGHRVDRNAPTFGPSFVARIELRRPRLSQLKRAPHHLRACLRSGPFEGNLAEVTVRTDVIGKNLNGHSHRRIALFTRSPRNCRGARKCIASNPSSLAAAAFTSESSIKTHSSARRPAFSNMKSNISR